MTFQQRQYQTDAVEALHEYICTKQTNPCIVLPTGSGKSVVMAETIRKWKQESPWIRGCILAHRKELVVQNAEKFRAVYNEEEIGIFSAGLGRKDYDSPILFASIDSIYRQSGNFQPFDFIFIDEAHRIPPAGEGKYRTFIKGCQRFNQAIKIIGWTATPFRMGCGPICHENHILNEICYKAKITELINDGYLCRLRSKVGNYQPALTEVKRNSNGDYVTASLAKATNRQSLISSAIREAVGIIQSENRKHVVFFCVDIEHCKRVSDELRKFGIYAPYLTGKTRQCDRDRIIGDFRSGRIQAVCNVNVLTEGFDAPHIDCIVLLRPTLSAGLFCVDSKTEILTKKGWKTRGKIATGESVASFNPETESIEFAPAISITDRSILDNEHIYSIETPSTSIRVTDNHRIVFKTRKTAQPNWKINTASEVANYKDGIIIPKAGYINNKDAAITDDELRFIGLIMTDGCINKRTNGIAITQSIHQPWIHEIQHIIDNCGLKNTVRDITRVTQFSAKSTIRLWTISKGKPRKTKKCLQGWGKLEEWLSKDFSEKLLYEISDRQFKILLEAIHLGDGAKQLKQTWVRRSYHISTGNKIFATRLQLCAILHGCQCSISEQHYNKNPLWYIHIKPSNVANIGSHYDGRPIWKKEKPAGEPVWCIQTKYGTIITRRNGKVTILGNSQMVGRGLRIWNNKTDCLVLDFANCIDEHGPIDLLSDNQRTVMAVCNNCRELFSRAVRVCPQCGWILPKQEIDRLENLERERRMHGDKVSDKSILSDEPRTLKVDAVYVSRHVKAGSPDSLRVQYRCGMGMYREWICLQHEGFAGQKARQWWRLRFGKDKEPVTVGNALQNMFLSQQILEWTKTITVKKVGKYFEIADYNKSLW